MKKLTVEQQRFIDDITLIGANRLLFIELGNKFPKLTLKEVMTIHNGQGLKESDRDQDGQYSVYGAGGVVGKHSERLTGEPFVVIGRKGSAGKPTYAPLGGWVIDTAYYAQPNDEKQLNIKYLFYAVSSLDFSDDIIVTAIPGINRTAIYRHRIPLPPAEIQKSCVRFLDAVSSKEDIPELPSSFNKLRRIIVHIDKLAAKVEQAQSLRQKSVVESAALWDSNLASIFERLRANYPTKTFQEFCEVVRGGSPRPAGDPIYYDGPIPFLKVADLTKDDSKYVTNHTFTIKKAGLHKTRLVEANTLMLTNSGATLGVPKICTFETTFNDGIQAFLHLPNDISKEYLHYFLRSKTRWFREFIARGQGQPNLNTNMLKTTSAPLPSLPEQRRIVAYLDSLQAKVEAVKHHQTATAAKLEALLPSILDKAFKGEL